MEFVEAMGIMNRMCLKSKHCSNCPMFEKLEDSAFNCMGFFQHCPEEAEEILTKWNAEHPVKTLKDVFNEAFPNAPKFREPAMGVPEICVSKVGGTPLFQLAQCGMLNCIKCWNQPYEELKK